MRKTRARKRNLTPDPKYKSELVTRFVNNLMWSGKKSTAFNIMYDALALIEEKMEKDGLEVFQTGLNNIMPSVEVKSRRVGGATFQVPIPVSAERKLSLGIKWLIRYSRSRGGKSMKDKLANEIMAAYRGEGGAVKKREDTHRMAEANKAFSHFKF